MSVGGYGKWEYTFNKILFAYLCNFDSDSDSDSNSGHIDVHVVRMRSDYRNLYRSHCSVLLVQHGGQRAHSVVRHVLK